MCFFEKSKFLNICLKHYYQHDANTSSTTKLEISNFISTNNTLSEFYVLENNIIHFFKDHFSNFFSNNKNRARARK
jgi:hypothetical protein